MIRRERHTHRGRTYEETGIFREPLKGEAFLSPVFGGVFTSGPTDLPGVGRVRHILRAVSRLEAVAGRRRRCYLSRQKLEETGEVRAPQKGEWFLTDDGSEVGVIASRSGAPLDGGEGIDRIILREVREKPRVCVTLDGAPLGGWHWTPGSYHWDTSPWLADGVVQTGRLRQPKPDPETRAREAEEKVERVEQARDLYIDAHRLAVKHHHREYKRARKAEGERDAALERVAELEDGQDALLQFAVKFGFDCGKLTEQILYPLHIVGGELH